MSLFPAAFSIFGPAFVVELILHRGESFDDAFDFLLELDAGQVLVVKNKGHPILPLKISFKLLFIQYPTPAKDSLHAQMRLVPFVCDLPHLLFPQKRSQI